MRKRALLICPWIYEYHKAISKELSNSGYFVDCFSERNEQFHSIIHFTSKFLKSANKLYSSNQNKIKRVIRNQKYDLVVLIRGEIITEDFIIQILDENLMPGGLSIYYSWDSVYNLPNELNIYKLFDKAYTFDKDDSNQYKGLSYLPLFYLHEYEESIDIKESNDSFDLVIVGAFSKYRYETVKKLEELGLSVCHYLYIKRIIFWRHKFFNGIYASVDDSYVKFKAMSTKQVTIMYRKANTILDLPSVKQSGLSLRAIECLGMDKKLLTTNSNIVNYDFYSKDMIKIFNSVEEIDDAMLSWMHTKGRGYSSDVRGKYSIKMWIKELLRR